MKIFSKKAFSKRTFKKMIMPFLITTQIVASLATVVMLINKKKTYAGVFAAISVIASVAAIVLARKRMLDKKEREAEESLFEDFDMDLEDLEEFEEAESDFDEDGEFDEIDNFDISEALNELDLGEIESDDSFDDAINAFSVSDDQN